VTGEPLQTGLVVVLMLIETGWLGVTSMVTEFDVAGLPAGQPYEDVRMQDIWSLLAGM